MKRDDKVTSGGMGSWLCPPGHPSHEFSVETDLGRKKENRGSMNIEYALTQSYIHPETRKDIEKLLSDYTPPVIGSSEFNYWAEDVMRYFKSLESQGVTFIQKYYPNYNQ